MKRRTAMPLWVGLTLIAFAFASQTWYRVTYDFDSHPRELKETGLAAWPAISGFLWLQLATFVLVLFLRGKARRIFAWVAASLTTVLGIFFCLPIFNTMSPSLANTISQKSGQTMPANAVVGGPVSHFATTAHAGIFALVLLLLVIIQMVSAASVGKWNLHSKQSRFEAPGASKNSTDEGTSATDPIQLWDSQRK